MTFPNRICGCRVTQLLNLLSRQRMRVPVSAAFAVTCTCRHAGVPMLIPCACSKPRLKRKLDEGAGPSTAPPQDFIAMRCDHMTLMLLPLH